LPPLPPPKIYARRQQITRELNQSGGNKAQACPVPPPFPIAAAAAAPYIQFAATNLPLSGLISCSLLQQG
jgi:hypothetical protein